MKRNILFDLTHHTINHKVTYSFFLFFRSFLSCIPFIQQYIRLSLILFFFSFCCRAWTTLMASMFLFSFSPALSFFMCSWYFPIVLSLLISLSGIVDYSNALLDISLPFMSSTWDYPRYSFSRHPT